MKIVFLIIIGVIKFNFLYRTGYAFFCYSHNFLYKKLKLSVLDSIEILFIGWFMILQLVSRFLYKTGFKFYSYYQDFLYRTGSRFSSYPPDFLYRTGCGYSRYSQDSHFRTGSGFSCYSPEFLSPFCQIFPHITIKVCILEKNCFKSVS